MNPDNHKVSVFLKDIIPWSIFVCLSALVISTTINIPVWDAWHNPELFDLLFTGKLKFSHLYDDINGHRLLFPRVIILFLGYMSNYDTRWEVVLNLFFGLYIFLLYRIFIINHIAINSVTKSLLSVIVAILIFSLVQYENWYFGWQICSFLCIAASLTAIALLCVNKNIFTYCLSIIFSIIATFSFANGLLLWPIGLFILIAIRRPIAFSIMWGLVGIAVYFLYFSSFSGEASVDYKKIPDHFMYFLIYLGAPLSIGNYFASSVWAVIGLALFAGTSYYLLSKKHYYRLFFTLFGFSVFSILTGLLISVARLNFGIEYSLLSRYTSFSVIFWASLSLMMAVSLNMMPRGFERNFFIFILLMIGLSSTKSSFQVMGEFAIHQKRMVMAKHELEKADLQDINRNIIKNITWDVDFTLQQAKLLRKHNLSFYAH